MTDWHSPMNKLEWIKAFRARKTRHSIDDGRVFTISYQKRTMLENCELKQTDMVLVKPVVGLVPMGWFRLDKVTSPGWLEEVK